MKKKILITLLSAILVITMMPLAVFGADSSASRSASSFSGGQRQRVAIASATKTGDALAKAKAYTDEELQLAAISFEDIEDMIMMRANREVKPLDPTQEFEIKKEESNRSTAARVLLQDMLSDGVVPVVDQEFYFQIVFVDEAEGEPYITTAGNQQNVLLKTSTLQRFGRELAVHDQTNLEKPIFIIDKNIKIEPIEDSAEVAEIVYLLPGALAYQNDEIRVDLLEAAKAGKVELHLADAEVALLEQAEAKIVLPDIAKEEVHTLINEGKVVVDAEQAEAYASSFGSGNTILIYACTGILVAACITAVVIARRKEKSR